MAPLLVVYCMFLGNIKLNPQNDCQLTYSQSSVQAQHQLFCSNLFQGFIFIPSTKTGKKHENLHGPYFFDKQCLINYRGHYECPYNTAILFVFHAQYLYTADTSEKLQKNIGEIVKFVLKQTVTTTILH